MFIKLHKKYIRLKIVEIGTIQLYNFREYYKTGKIKKIRK